MLEFRRFEYDTVQLKNCFRFLLRYWQHCHQQQSMPHGSQKGSSALIDEALRRPKALRFDERLAIAFFN